jgi:DNA-directed RNA polymerase specialized sigma24 family protein
VQGHQRFLELHSGAEVEDAGFEAGDGAVDFAQVSVQISLLLQSDGQGVRRALALADEHFRRPVAAVVRKSFPELPSEDLVDVCREAFLELCQSALDGRVDAQKSVFPLLCTMALRRATDLWRHRAVEHRALSEVLGPIARALRGTGTGRRWQALDATDRKEVMQLIRTAIARLPPRQKLVMDAYVQGYPDTENMEALRQQVTGATGCEETVAAVKRALQEARQKVRAFLRDKGYDFGEGGQA